MNVTTKSAAIGLQTKNQSTRCKCRQQKPQRWKHGFWRKVTHELPVPPQAKKYSPIVWLLMYSTTLASLRLLLWPLCLWSTSYPSFVFLFSTHSPSLGSLFEGGMIASIPHEENISCNAASKKEHIPSAQQAKAKCGAARKRGALLRCCAPKLLKMMPGKPGDDRKLWEI